MKTSKEKQKTCCGQQTWDTLISIFMYVCLYSSVSYFSGHFVMVFLDIMQEWKGFSQDISAGLCSYRQAHAILRSILNKKNLSFLTERQFQNIQIPPAQISSAYIQIMLKLYFIDYLALQEFSLFSCMPRNFSSGW